jgi:transaldolase
MHMKRPSWEAVAGITTNPTLIALESTSPIEQMMRLLQVFPRTLFHQPASTDPLEVLEEFRVLWDAGGGRVIAKIPATTSLFRGLFRR